VGSKRIWTVKLKFKTESDEAIADSRARSSKQCKILRTDGDEIFPNRSFLELKENLKFLHERPAPYDHDQSGMVDRECRTLLESVSTSMAQSGAPPSMWGEAVQHFTFTRNNIPRVERQIEGKKIYVSAENILTGSHHPFSLKHLVAFGTSGHCFLDVSQRDGRV
jgi:hypothetical protein